MQCAQSAEETQGRHRSALRGLWSRPVLTGPGHRHETDRFPGYNNPGVKHEPQPQGQGHCRRSCGRREDKDAPHSTELRMRAALRQPRGAVKVQQLRALRRLKPACATSCWAGLRSGSGSPTSEDCGCGVATARTEALIRKLSAGEDAFPPSVRSGHLRALS